MKKSELLKLEMKKLHQEQLDDKAKEQKEREDNLFTLRLKILELIRSRHGYGPGTMSEITTDITSNLILNQVEIYLEDNFSWKPNR